ncbi:MAG: SpoIIE family protein phosphatase [Bdellovibrionaceae bacterium]|nr:SpoIIE family protein phosphatase [Bdellovibrio sp.]
MAQDEEVAALKNKITELEQLLQSKNMEVMTYRQELAKFSQALDRLMVQISGDMPMLAKVQKAITPTELPTIPGFEISRKFVYGTQSGGDYFDVFEHEDKFRFGLLVASSSGYAMSALFLSLILKISHVLEAKKGTPPDRIMQQIAEDLKPLAGPNDVTHAFYAVIDRRDYTLKFCSAGSIGAYYMSPGKSLQTLKSSLSPFGQYFAGQLSCASIELDPRSRVCIVTGGLTDVLGEEQIVKIINDTAKAGVHDLRNELLFQAQKKTNLVEPLRDQTVVVIDVKDRVIKLAK